MTWETQVEEVRAQLDAMHDAREAALRQCRLLIQTSSKCIRSVHRRNFEEAERYLAEARTIGQGARDSLAQHPELYYAGYLQDAEKEMVEAAAVLQWTRPGQPNTGAPDRLELGVSVASYLNGLGEAASECRRYLLDDLRQGNLTESERLLKQMEIVYDDLVSFDYPDALTGGLRRTCDALRAVIERTRGDLTMTRVQHKLIEELRRTQDNLTEQQGPISP